MNTETTASAASAAAESRLLVDERDRLLALLGNVVEVFGHALPFGTEVVLHDLGRLPNSIVAITGTLSGRQVGGTSADILVERIIAADGDKVLGYDSTLPDGRWIHSCAMIARDTAGTPVAALCINTERALWESVAHIADSMLGFQSSHVEARSRGRDIAGLSATSRSFERQDFTDGPDSFTELMISRQIAATGLDVAAMRKQHKMTVVQALQSRGLFELRGAVPQVAAALDVSRFTIYNYLKELGDPGRDGDEPEEIAIEVAS